MARWQNLDKVEWSRARRALKEYFTDEYDRAEFERITALMMIGATMGPCCLVSFTAVLARYLLMGRHSVDLMLCLFALTLGIIFVALAWLKAAQCTQEAATIIRESHSRKEALE